MLRSRRILVASAALFVAGALATGCSTDALNPQADPYVGAWWECPPVKSNPTGLEHGKACTTDAECMYGKCMKGTFVTGYDASKGGICTKNSGCAKKSGGNGDTVSCATDNSSKMSYYTSFEKSKTYPNPKRTSSDPYSFCLPKCTSDKECVAWNPNTPHCIKSSTTYISVNSRNACGFDPFR